MLSVFFQVNASVFYLIIGLNSTSPLCTLLDLIKYHKLLHYKIWWKKRQKPSKILLCVLKIAFKGKQMVNTKCEANISPMHLLFFTVCWYLFWMQQRFCFHLLTRSSWKWVGCHLLVENDSAGVHACSLHRVYCISGDH